MNVKNVSNEKQKLAETALEQIQKREKDKKLVIEKIESDVIPTTNEMYHRLWAYNPENPNSTHHIIVNSDGKPVDMETLRESYAMIFKPKVTEVHKVEYHLPRLPRRPVTVSPPTNNLTLVPGDQYNEKIVVNLPVGTHNPKGDIYILVDNTGSMGSAISQVQTDVSTLITSLSTTGYDLAFGVGNYRDFQNNYAFKHQQKITKNMIDVASAIHNWSAMGGGDFPEAQLYAFDQLIQPPNSTIGWRKDSKKIILWIGDAPGHDPICPDVSTLSYTITEKSVTQKLVKNSITVIAIGVVRLGALDLDPTGGSPYSDTCPVGGTPGQATRITNATHGTYKETMNPTEIVSTVISLLKNAITSIGKVTLQPTGSAAPFVTNITPVDGYGPLRTDTSHQLPFNVTFTGVKPCTDVPQVYIGSIEVHADGVKVAEKTVTVTVPACEKYSYSVKYLCGLQREQRLIAAGKYATEINIHNYNSEPAYIHKYLYPILHHEKVLAREPKTMERRVKDVITLPPNAVTMDDCRRIHELYNIHTDPEDSLLIGVLEITSSVKLAITAVYTLSDLEGHPVSLEVERIPVNMKQVKDRD